MEKVYHLWTESVPRCRILRYHRAMAKKHTPNPVLGIVVSILSVGALSFVAFLLLGSLLNLMPAGPVVEELLSIVMIVLLYVVFPGASGAMVTYTVPKDIPLGTHLLTSALTFTAAHAPAGLMVAFAAMMFSENSTNWALMFFGVLTAFAVSVCILTLIYFSSYYGTRYLRGKR